MQVPTTFRERLLLARRRVGLEQAELGRMVGLTGHTIGRLERGDTRQISIEALRRVARALGVTTDWLLAMDALEEDSPEEDAPLLAPHV